MWSHVNKLFPKTKSSGIPSLEIDGRLITTPKDIANKFNTFFVSIGENLANLKGLNQAKIFKKSVILFWLLDMTIWCKHVHRLQLQKFLIFVPRIHQ